MNNDFNLNGFGNIPTGEYENININGMSKFTADIKAKNISIAGIANGTGAIYAKDILINGTYKQSGMIEANKLMVNGMSNIDGPCNIKSIIVAGRTKFNKSVIFNDVVINGSLIVKGDFEGNKFISNGKISIDGLLSADDIEFRLNFASNVKEIGGEKIVVKKDCNVVFKSKNSVGSIITKFIKDIRLQVQIIEGDNITLEFTTAKKVCGNNIIIGEGCIIDEVICSGNLTIHPNSIVKNKDSNQPIMIDLEKGE